MLRVFFSLIVMLLIGVTLVQAQPIAQVPTETPALLNLAPVAQQQPTLDTGGPTATRTPTPLGIALLEAIEFANVRAEPSTEAAQLGTIRAGETYNVIARYVSWYQFEYPPSPTGRGWVFGELVSVTGNSENIPEIDPFASDSQLDSAAQGATATQSILTQTPGGVLTATALSQQLGLPGAVTATAQGTQGILPTYTFPPGMVAIAPTAGLAASPEFADGSNPPVPTTTNTGVPPIAPILLLGAVGLLGLAISSLRRG